MQEEQTGRRDALKKMLDRLCFEQSFCASCTQKQMMQDDEDDEAIADTPGKKVLFFNQLCFGRFLPVTDNVRRKTFCFFK